MGAVKANILIDEMGGFPKPRVVRAEVKVRKFSIGKFEYKIPVALIGEARFLVIEASKLDMGLIKSAQKVNVQIDFYAVAQVPIITYESSGCGTACDSYHWKDGLRIYSRNLKKLALMKMLKDRGEASGSG